MTWTRTALPVCAAVTALVGGLSPADAATRRTVARWEMNEPVGASVMRDSSTRSIDGAIGSAVRTGVSARGSVWFRWPYVDPHAPPAVPDRLVTVQDGRLNPGTRDFVVALRFRTTYPSANIVQKGQARASGGFWKVEIQRGRMTCVFRGRNADGARVGRAVNSAGPRLDDGKWHSIRCVRTRAGVTMTVDSERPQHSAGVTGRIFNDVPLTIGGKLRCDQVEVSCDYFSGALDRVVVRTG